METKLKYVIIFFKDRYEMVEIEKIIRLQSDNGYTDIYTDTGRIITSCNSLTDCETSLQGNSFFRIHNSHLVRLNRIEVIEPGDNYFVLMSDKSRVPVSRRKKDGFLAHYIVL